ncbi:hypothetical protein HYQ46_009481 [Verticillium longisporum]|nr:hypothetical protein HYQ46_009481 [Verticillium longisporum]
MARDVKTQKERPTRKPSSSGLVFTITLLLFYCLIAKYVRFYNQHRQVLLAQENRAETGEYMRKLVALAHQIARAKKLNPRAVFIRSGLHDTTSINGVY